jgi:hypothetical protein
VTGNRILPAIELGEKCVQLHSDRKTLLGTEQVYRVFAHAHDIIPSVPPDIALGCGGCRLPKLKMADRELEVEITLERKVLAQLLERLPRHFPICTAQM